VVGRGQAGCAVPAGDQDDHRAVPRGRDQRARLRGGGARRGPLERGSAAVQRRARGHQPGVPRPAQLRGRGGRRSRADPARRAGRAHARGPGRRRHLRRCPGLVAVRPERPHSRVGPLRLQAGVVRRVPYRARGRAEPVRPARGGRGLQRGAHRRRRVGPGGVRPFHPRDAARAAGPGRPTRARADRRDPEADEGPAPVHVLGLPGGRVRQGHGHAHRPGVRQRGRRRPGDRRLRGPGSPQGQGPVRPRPDRRRPGLTGPGSRSRRS